MTREEEEKIKLIKLGKEEDTSNENLNIEQPTNKRTSFFRSTGATGLTAMQQKIAPQIVGESYDSYNNSILEAEKEFQHIKDVSPNRDMLVNQYKAYSDQVARDVSNQDNVRYQKDKIVMDLIESELSRTANIGTYAQDVFNEIGGEARLATADAYRNVAKAATNLEVASDGFNADRLYNIATQAAGTDISKIGTADMTGTNYNVKMYDMLKDLYERHPDDRTIEYVYNLVTKKGYTGDKDFFKNTVPYLNQMLKQDKYNQSALVRNTEDEIQYVQNLKEREALSDYGALANWGLQGVGVASYMIPSVAAGIATGGITEGLAGAGVITASEAGINTASQIGSLGSMYMSSAGRAFDDAIKQGYDWDRASLYSQLIGGLEVTTELIGGENVMGFLSGRTGGTALSKATQELIKKGGNAASRFIIGMAADIGAEIIEEEISALVEPIIDKAVLGKDTTIEEYLQSALSAATDTVLPTLIMGGLGKARIANSVTKTQTRLNTKIDALLSSNVITKEEADNLKKIVSDWTNDAIDGVYEREEEIKNKLGTINYKQTYDEAMGNINAQLNQKLMTNNIVQNPEYASNREIQDLGTKVEVSYKNKAAIESDIETLMKDNPSIKSMTPATTINKMQQTIKTFLEKVTGKQVVYVNIENAPNEFDYGFTNKKGNNLYLNSKLDTADTLAAGFHEAGHHFAKTYDNLFKKFNSKISDAKVNELKKKSVFKGLDNKGIREELFGNYLGSVLTNAKTTKKLEKSTQTLVENVKDMFNFMSKNSDSKVSQYNTDYINYLGDAIVNDKALEKAVLDTFKLSAKENKGTAPAAEVSEEVASKVDTKALREERLKKALERNANKTETKVEKEAPPKRLEVKKDDGKSKEKVAKPSNSSKENKKEEPKAAKAPPKRFEAKTGLRQQLVKNMVKQLSEMEVTPHNIEELVAETLDAATERQLEKLYDQYNLSQRTLNRLQGKMYNEVEQTLKKVEKGDIKYSRFVDDVEVIGDFYNLGLDKVASAINTDTPKMKTGINSKSHGNNEYLFIKNEFDKYDLIEEKKISNSLLQIGGKIYDEESRNVDKDNGKGKDRQADNDGNDTISGKGKSSGGNVGPNPPRGKGSYGLPMVPTQSGGNIGTYLTEKSMNDIYKKATQMLQELVENSNGEVIEDTLEKIKNSIKPRLEKETSQDIVRYAANGKYEVYQDVENAISNAIQNYNKKHPANNIKFSRTINDGSFILPGKRTYDTRNFPVYVAKNGKKVYYATSKDFYNSKPADGKIRLYTNTPFRNIDSILEKGILHEGGKLFRNPEGREYEGDAIWLENRPDLRGYGGTTIAVEIEPTDNLRKVNDTQYMLYEDIKPENIVFIDKPIAEDGGDPYRTSDIQDLFDKYGKNLVVEVFNEINQKYEKGNNNFWTVPKDELNYILDTVPAKATEKDYSGGYTTAEGTPITNGVEKWGKESEMKENGKLETYYHGSPFFFDEFNPPYIHSGRDLGDGNYVTKNKKFAQKYAEGKLYEFVLNIKNPFNDKAWARDFEKILKKVPELVEIFDQEGIEEHKNWGKEGWVEEVQYLLETPRYGSDELAGLDGEPIPTAKAVVDIIKDMARRNGIDTTEIWKWLGYDGLEIGDEVVFFDSNQAKFLDNPNPTEDSRFAYSRTITESNDGRELTEGQQEWNEGNKVVDSKGRLKHLYHGTNNGEFYIFDEELANVEGDWGAGFYLTDNEMDVNENYYGGGPDFEGKVSRLADHIYDQSDMDMSYSVAKERAREILEKGEYRIDAYGKMLNPAIVGETRLFDYSPDDVDVYREDYSSDDDYEEAIIYAIYDKVDEAIDEAALYVDNHIDNVDFGDYKTVKSAISQVIAENVIEPGSGIEMQNFKNELVDKLIDAGKYDNDGEWQSYASEIVRLIIQSQGYDGIIDPTVSKKFKNMNLDSSTTHYIFFEPNQIKDVDNLNPTDNPDIRYSKAQSKATKELLKKVRMTEDEDELQTFVDNTFVRIMRRINREIFNNAEALVQFDNKVAKAMGKKIADVPTFLKLFDNWRRAGNSDSIIAQIAKGAYDDATGKKLTKGLANIIGDLVPSRKEARAMGMSRNEAIQYRIEQLIALGVAERAQELEERDIESGIDYDVRQAVMEEYKDDAKLHKALQEIREDGSALIDYLVKKHVLQEETANIIKENNLLYFPFNRVLSEDTTRYGLGKKDGAVGRAIVGIKGSDLMLENPLVSVVGNWARMLQVIDQQTMIEKMKEAGKYLGKQEGLYFEDVKPLIKYQGEVGMDIFKGNIATQLENLGYDDVVDRLDWNSLYQLFVPEKADPKKMTISYFDEKGKRKYIKFADNDYGKPLFDILSNLNPMQSNKFLDFVNLLSQGVRLGATTMNWEFALGNMMSDSAQAYLYSEGFVVPLVSSIFDIYKLGVGRGYVPAFKKDYADYYEKFKRSGASLSGQFRGNSKYIRGKSNEVFGFTEDQLFGSMGLNDAKNFRDVRKTLKKNASKILNNVTEFLQFVPEYSEEATRFAEFVRVYDKMIKKGWTQENAIKEAGIKAREITQDFSIQGNTMKSVNKVIPFSAASMGGLYRFGRELKTHPVRLTSRLTIMAAFVLLMLETFRDDDDRKWYEEMNKQKKFDNYVINNGTSEPIIIKKPQGPARYFVNFVELIYNIVNGYVEEDKIGEAVKDWAEMSAKDQLPITNASDFVPGGLQAFLENEVNRDFYYGSAIVPQSLEKLEPRHQYNENTSEFAKALGDIFNWSPLKIDNVVKSSFAGLGKLFLEATDEAAAMFGANEKPSKSKGERYLIDKFYANALKNPESVNYVYDRFEELETEKAEGRMTAKEQREYEKLSVAKSTLADINKQIKEIKGNEKLSGTKKTEKIEDLKEMQVDVARYYTGKPLIEKSNKAKIELMEYYPSQDTYIYTVNKDNKINLDFSSNALKTEYAKMFKEKYDELLKELKASSEYQQATATTKVTLEKETKTKARTATTNDMKKIVFERTKG